MKTVILFLIFTLSSQVFGKNSVCETEKEAYKSAKSSAKEACIELKGKEKRECKKQAIVESKLAFDKCKKENKKAKNPKKTKRKADKYCGKILKLLQTNKLPKEERWLKLTDPKLESICTKEDFKEAQCISKDKTWVEKSKGKFKCLKKSKLAIVSDVELALDPKKDSKKFEKCQKYWKKVRKRFSGEFIKVKHFKRLKKLGCIKERK